MRLVVADKFEAHVKKLGAQPSTPYIGNSGWILVRVIASGKLAASILDLVQVRRVDLCPVCDAVNDDFQDQSLIDVAIVQRIIDWTRFPAIDHDRSLDIRGLPGLGRSADLIGQFSDRNYLQKLPALFYEFEQNGANESMGYRHVKDIRLGLSGFYWNCVHEYLEDAIAYLNHTPTGQQIVTELWANVSAAKTSLCA